MAGAVTVEGLAELRKALKKLGDAESSTEVRKALKAAADIVAREAKTRVPSGGSGRAAGSIRPGTSGVKAFVAGGKKDVPYYGWLDFGSRNPRRGNPRSVGPWAGSGKGPAQGRFLYPALEDKRADVVQYLQDALDSIVQEEGLA